MSLKGENLKAQIHGQNPLFDTAVLKEASNRLMYVEIWIVFASGDWEKRLLTNHWQTSVNPFRSLNLPLVAQKLEM